MKILKWVVGVPAGIFAIVVVWQLIFGSGKDGAQRALSDCYAEANSYLQSDPGRAVSTQGRCENMNRALNPPNPGAVYRN